jgi:hypothetical protein
MRALQLRVLLLYPRFHEAVAADLGGDPAAVRDNSSCRRGGSPRDIHL